jgi:exodeoxyribonuclease VII large subunit
VNARVIPVGLLAAYVRELLEGDAILSDVWVEGEVASLFRAQSGHVYFTVKDDEAALKCVLFRALAGRQLSLPQPGEQVAVHGHVTLYPRDGAVQLYADVVQPAGLGILALQLEQLRQRLEAEGLFDPSRKRALPYAPRAIGVVTSPDGAVWHDIQTVLRRRYPLVELILAPTPVQGDAASEGIVAALAALQTVERIEVVIVARGGGSADDLAAFNDERVVRAVFAARAPVVSGVGHETDWTLTDLVADVRAPTPSAAAEICVPSIRELADRVAGCGERLARSARQELAGARRPFADLAARLHRLDPANRVRDERRHLIDLRRRLSLCQVAVLLGARGNLAAQEGILRALEPAAVLGRGYAILRDGETNASVGRIEQTAPGRPLVAHFADGSLTARVERISPDNNLAAMATPR